MKSPLSSWRRGIAEFLIIVIGVLVALAVDRWNQSRDERAQEREYLERLYEDVQADTATLSSILAGLVEKQESLESLAELTDGDPRSVADTADLINALATGTDYGWIIPPLRTVTFEDLTSTGNLGLIQEATVRAAVIEYYQNALHRANRVERRGTAYAPMVYSLVPPGILPQTGQSSGQAPAALEIDVTGIVDRLRSSDLQRQLAAERNYAAFAYNRLEVTRTEAVELLGILLAYLQR
jgi:hypothetical protein